MSFGRLCLGNGNIKVGEGVLTFSLPSRFTCPGATAWCLKRCYAARMERLRKPCLRAYSENLMLTWNPGRFIESILDRLPIAGAAVRIHVSGDFYSEAYINAWKTICEERPYVHFWSYTRSWNVASLAPALEAIRDLDNIQLFASVDSMMSMPPANWRLAFLENDPRASGIQCRKQAGERSFCMTCGYCYHEKEGNVIFRIH